MTAKFDNFKEALIALCKEHAVMLAYSYSDEVNVFDEDGDYPSNIMRIEDILWDDTVEQSPQSNSKP